ncbi:hypothetical protein SAMN05443287_115102 [Micromonospora phaseoli]|uniref:Uncharacterized protein n=1 Tax=Micromonospora phaseoli TaxID=1144548 RepID=A0A1H7DP26_9ACTN|nr:hypothetical protein [Micromonospora phaseoli]PZV89502.1 hypothetical protein CLV64_115103 [Micromonospora phaseoli]GIJ80584.1 hypothetical protein Xph01_50160 [Micromonospora phaseoli]SEK03318.1 hypothetical protein SAMN05443287_115102 [Micromonospora phaseoli]
MEPGPPSRIAIDHDDYHAEHVGRTADGRQFFLTTPFEPAYGNDEGQEFVACYLFDTEGRFLEARIDTFGSRALMDREARRTAYEARLAELGEVTFTRIEVEPFSVDRFGTTFGLIPRAPEDDDDTWWVTLEPGDYMAFSPPWDSGEYDT